MGVHGLTSLIDNNPHVLKDYQLHDCKVVIDGNNLYYFLYLYCHVRYQFSGDFDIFRRKICMIFSLFKKCNVEPYLVFDGSQTTDGRKFQTIIDRAKDRILSAGRIVRGQRGTLLPCLAQEAFKQTLNEIGVNHVTCDFEADSQMAVLANEWGCPVISCDSDFYIYSVTGGFLPLDYVDFRPVHCSIKGQTYAYLPVKFYHLDHFISHCPFKRSVLPLFASILGNDYIDVRDFQRFYLMLSQKSVPRSRFLPATKKHEQILLLMDWLENRAIEDGISEVMNFIDQEKRPKFLQKLRQSISGYVDIQTYESFNLKEYFETGHKALSVKRNPGVELPAWFVKAYRAGTVSPVVLNATVVHRVILPIQVESIQWPASFCVSRHLREAIYSIILNTDSSAVTFGECRDLLDLCAHTPSFRNCKNIDGDFEVGEKTSTPGDGDGMIISGTGGNTHKMCQQPVHCSESVARKSEEFSKRPGGVEEYTRVNRELHKILIKPLVSLPNFGTLPALADIDKLVLSHRRALVMEVMGISQNLVKKFDSSLELFMMCLVFWMRNSDPKVTAHHLRGFLVSAILLHVHREITQREEQLKEEGEREGEPPFDVHAEAEGESQENKAEIKQAAYHEVSKNTRHQGKDHSATKHTKEANLSSETAAYECEGRKHVESVYTVEASLSIEEVCNAADSQLLHRIRDNLKKYYKEPLKQGKTFQPDYPIFHRTATFMACMLDGINLNSVLARPMASPQLALLLNGTFIYNIVWELQARSSPDLFLQEMLVKGSPVAELFISLYAALLSEAGEAIQDVQKQGNKCCKSARKRKKSKSKNIQCEDAENSAAFVQDSLDAGSLEVDCAVSNRFGVFMLDE